MVSKVQHIHFLCTHDSRYFLQAALKTLKKYKKAQTAAINNSSTASSIKAGVHQHDFSDTYILILPYYSPNLGSKRKRCYSCSACLREDCGTCKFCVNKPKYGGPGKKKQCCVKRCCLAMKADILSPPSPERKAQGLEH